MRKLATVRTFCMTFSLCDRPAVPTSPYSMRMPAQGCFAFNTNGFNALPRTRASKIDKMPPPVFGAPPVRLGKQLHTADDDSAVWRCHDHGVPMLPGPYHTAMLPGLLSSSPSSGLPSLIHTLLHTLSLL